MEDLIDDAGEDVPSAAEMIKMRREIREVRGKWPGWEGRLHPRLPSSLSC